MERNYNYDAFLEAVVRRNAMPDFGDDEDYLELFRRNAMSGIVDTQRSIRWKWRESVRDIGARTNRVREFPFRTAVEALMQLEIPPFTEMGFVFRREWNDGGGARWLVERWRSGLNDLLLRMQWIKTQGEEGAVVRMGARLQMRETGFEPFEAHCCAIRNLLERINSRGDELLNAPFWEEFERVCDGGASFWDLWWTCARRQMALTETARDDSGEVSIEIAVHGLELLRPAALALFRRNDAPCRKELDWQLEEDIEGEFALSPPFALAVDMLGLTAYSANSGTPSAHLWSTKEARGGA